MKFTKYIQILAATCVCAFSSSLANGQGLAVQKTSASEGEGCGLPVSGISLSKDNGNMNVEMALNLGEYKMKGDRAAIFTPVLVNGEDSIDLPPVGLYSRTRYIQYIRRDETPIGGDDETTFKYSKRPAVMDYSLSVPYQEWMNGAALKINRTDYGCCNTVLERCQSPLSSWSEITYTPEFYFQETVAATIKTREISGRAYVDFPVNLTVIYPDYRRNSVELAKIIATIDSVKNDKDITVTSISIKGFASPEGPYDNNIRLAKGRTEALKNYVQQLYKFPEGFIKTSYEPEDWEGLREWVVNSNIDNKEGILAIIDSDLAPDPKNTKIQTTYPVQYKWLLENIYPGLRHSDYRIEYEIRQFTDVAEIAEVFETAPQKLGLNEMYALANSLEPGSPKYNEVFETAVRMYPADEAANLNAANIAMQRGDYETAQKYLAKAGGSEAAIYARGVMAANQGDYRKALDLFRQAPSIPPAARAVETLQILIE